MENPFAFIGNRVLNSINLVLNADGGADSQAKQVQADLLQLPPDVRVVYEQFHRLTTTVPIGDWQQATTRSTQGFTRDDYWIREGVTQLELSESHIPLYSELGEPLGMSHVVLAATTEVRTGVKHELPIPSSVCHNLLRTLQQNLDLRDVQLPDVQGS